MYKGKKWKTYIYYFDFFMLPLTLPYLLLYFGEEEYYDLRIVIGISFYFHVCIYFARKDHNYPVKREALDLKLLQGYKKIQKVKKKKETERAQFKLHN